MPVEEFDEGFDEERDVASYVFTNTYSALEITYAAHRSTRPESHQKSAERIAQLRPIDVARLHPLRSVHHRQAEAHDRRRRPAWDDFQSLHLRKGHRRQLAL